MRRKSSDSDPNGRLRDESGVALVLAISVFLIVGVMGAGLLVVVRSDLAATVEANRGQRALLAADAGADLAKRQLLSDARPTAYDADGAGKAACDSPDDSGKPFSSPWSEAGGGVEREYEGGEFTVSVRWTPDGCAPPGVTRDERGREHFTVVSEGRSGKTRRSVEAVYATVPGGAPLGVYAARDVRLLSGSSVTDTSVFAGRDVSVGTGASVAGTDWTHGDWTGERNPTGRPDDLAAVAAVGRVSGDPGSSFFDRDTTPAFGASAQEGLTFPFDPGYWNDRRLGFLREEARSSGGYRESGEGFAWPGGAERHGVVFIERGDLTLDRSDCPAESPCRGTLAVREGTVVLGSDARFEGGIVTGSGDVLLRSGSGLAGFVASGGDVEVRGEVRGAGSGAASRTGLHRVETVSWREVYR